MYTAQQFKTGDIETDSQVEEALCEGLAWQIKQIKLLKEIEQRTKLKKDTKLQIKLAEERLIKNYKHQEKMIKNNVPYWFRSLSVERIKEEEHNLNKLLLRNSFETGVKEGISPASINQAKNYPIENLLELNQKGFAITNPLRKEKTSSFYCKNNFWHDFGNGETGDVIDLVMRMYKMSFNEAINKLNEKTNNSLGYRTC